MRLFLAIPLADETRAGLAAIQRALRPIAPFAPTRPDNLHLTLKFLGEVPDPAVPPLCDTLAALPKTGPFTLAPSHLVLFPPRGPIRIIAAAPDAPPPPLITLAEQIESACHAHGFPRENRPFSPHITLARARNPLHNSLRPRLLAAAPSPWTVPPTPVSSFILMQSLLLPAGPQYTPVATFYI